MKTKCDCGAPCSETYRYLSDDRCEACRRGGSVSEFTSEELLAFCLRKPETSAAYARALGLAECTGRDVAALDRLYLAWNNAGLPMSGSVVGRLPDGRVAMVGPLFGMAVPS